MLLLPEALQRSKNQYAFGSRWALDINVLILNKGLSWWAVVLYWLHFRAAGVPALQFHRGLARGGFIQKFVGPEPALQNFRRDIWNRIQRWVDNQHLVMWRGACRAQRQTRKLISGPSLATKIRLLSFNTTQWRVVAGLLTGHNTLQWGWVIIPHVGSEVLRRKPQSSFHVSGRPWLTQTCISGFLLGGGGSSVKLGKKSKGGKWNFGEGKGLL